MIVNGERSQVRVANNADGTMRLTIAKPLASETAHIDLSVDQARHLALCLHALIGDVNENAPSP